MNELQTSRIFPFPLLTPRGLAVLGLAAVIPVAGIAGDIPLPEVLVGLALFAACFLIAIFINVKNILEADAKLRMRLECRPLWHSGVPTDIKIEIAGTTLARPVDLEVRLTLPGDLQMDGEIRRVRIPAGTSVSELSYQVTPLARGAIAIENIYIRFGCSPRLARQQMTVSPVEPLQVQVLPNNGMATTEMLLALQRQNSGELTLANQRAEGREFHSLRQYAVGDDMRKVDWKRSAKGRHLYVKIYRPETHQRINIAIDCGRRMGNRVFDRSQMEFAVEAASHVLKLAARSEDEVGLFAFSYQTICKIGCRKGARQERLITETLKGLKSDEVESDYQLLTQWATTSRRRSLLLLITSISNPAGLESIRQAMAPLRRRHLPIVFAIADQELQELVELTPGNLTQAYTVAAGMQQLEHISQEAERLSRMGIDCYYCRADQLPQMVRRTYEEIKRSGRL